MSRVEDESPSCCLRSERLLAQRLSAPMRSAVHVLLATFVAKIAECSWFPLNFNDFQCFDQRIFDETKGQKARYNVSDPRITAAVEELLRESGDFWGHSVPRTAANLQNRLVNDSAPPKTGWKGLGSASDALIIEVNNWDTHILSSWVATILLKEKVGYNVAHFQSGGAGGTGVAGAKSQVGTNLGHYHICF